LWRALQIVQQVDTEAVAARALERGHSGPAIGQAVREARVAALAAAL
jgi:tRNA nucleotidyltransferase (CCA-adding enzyme)